MVVRRNPLSTRTWLAAAWLMPLLAGCAGGGLSDALSGFGVQRAAPGTPSGFSFTPDNRPGAARGASLIGSEVEGLFRKHPITNSQRPETWPRVAVTIVSATPGVFQTSGVTGTATMAATDCAVFNLRVWTSASESKAHENLRLCYGELYQRLQRVPLYQVPTWGRRGFWRGQQTSGSVRNDGPLPPAEHFPTDAVLQHHWLDRFQNGLAFVAGALHVLGYDWNDLNDKRVWFVSVPAGPGR
jgi:hypothetical protein